MTLLLHYPLMQTNKIYGNLINENDAIVCTNKDITFVQSILKQSLTYNTRAMEDQSLLQRENFRQQFCNISTQAFCKTRS